MPLLNYLQFQEIDSDSDDIPENHQLNDKDEISLNDPIDENSLENFWDKVDEDIREDPEWFSFADN